MEPFTNISHVQELTTLRAQIRDLAALLALAAMWRGRELPFIAGSLLEALVSLLRLDVAYIRLEDPNGGRPLDDRRPLGKIDEVVDHLVDESQGPSVAGVHTIEIGDRAPLRVVRFDPRLDRERGMILVGARRDTFPTEVESFLLHIAVEQGMVALQSSRLLRDLQTANRAKSEFLATMSHELRTPLNAILGYVDLLDAGVSGELNTQQKQNLARVRAGSRHLLELIEGILTFARIDAGREEVTFTVVNLGELLSETAALIEPLVVAKGLDFHITVPAEETTILSDGGKVRQILLNLLSNSIKFTSSGSITLVLQREAEIVRLIVRDTGSGIPATELDNIFEPFRQVGSVYTNKAAGTGLGLSVSRQLARLMGGEIVVQSTVGVGTMFAVELPTRVLG